MVKKENKRPKLLQQFVKGFVDGTIVFLIMKLLRKGYVRPGLFKRTNVYRNAISSAIISFATAFCNYVLPMFPIFHFLYNHKITRPIYGFMMAPFHFLITRLVTIPFALMVKPGIINCENIFQEAFQRFQKDFRKTIVYYEIRYSSNNLWTAVFSMFNNPKSLLLTACRNALRSVLSVFLTYIVYHPFSHMLFGTTIEETKAKIIDNTQYMIVFAFVSAITSNIIEKIEALMQRKKKEKQEKKIDKSKKSKKDVKDSKEENKKEEVKNREKEDKVKTD